MTAGTILAVDDERVVLRIIREYLETNDFEVVTASDGAQGLAILNQDPERFDAVVLDRMMPVMDGMELLKTIRADPRLFHLPVVMQTAATAAKQVQEGIDAGAFYYITKPYDEGTLVAIVRSAVKNSRQTREMLRGMAEGTMGVDLLREGTFEVRTPQDGKAVAWMIAQQAESAVPVMMGLVELINNAIEHGNLQIGWSGKSELAHAGLLDQEVIRRLTLAENQNKRVQVWFKRDGCRVTVSIKDQGVGFDWEPYTHITPDRVYDAHGRGIVTARTLSFDSVEYLENGSRVVVEFSAIEDY